MSVQLNREHPQGKPASIKPTVFFPIDRVPTRSSTEVLNEKCMQQMQDFAIKETCLYPALWTLKTTETILTRIKKNNSGVFVFC